MLLPRGVGRKSTFGSSIVRGTAAGSVASVGPPIGSVTIPFTPSVGTWYFFRLFYDNILNVIGLQINNGTIFTGAVAGGIIAPGGIPLNEFNLTITGGTPGSITTVVYDEIAIWDTNISEAVGLFLYNNGAGRTFPFS